MLLADVHLLERFSKAFGKGRLPKSTLACVLNLLPTHSRYVWDFCTRVPTCIHPGIMSRLAYRYMFHRARGESSCNCAAFEPPPLPLAASAHPVPAAARSIRAPEEETAEGDAGRRLPARAARRAAENSRSSRHGCGLPLVSTGVPAPPSARVSDSATSLCASGRGT